MSKSTLEAKFYFFYFLDEISSFVFNGVFLFFIVYKTPIEMAATEEIRNLIQKKLDEEGITTQN